LVTSTVLGLVREVEIFLGARQEKEEGGNWGNAQGGFGLVIASSPASCTLKGGADRERCRKFFNFKEGGLERNISFQKTKREKNLPAGW